ncbi:MAG TPA: class I SAM-dependent methyltransferase [Terriglobia bacterium]|nr:class I SAM-dependent methyltransferase [Terriglobia bacterium]
MNPAELLKDSTERFSTRVENYVRYRPGYPEQILGLLDRECRLAPDSVIADIGSGTGLLSELFLKNGNPVYAVEPNREMRQAGERSLAAYPEFRSFDGRAESIPLEPQSVDFVVAGQAFHWFDRELCRGEFARILRQSGWVAIIWNTRRMAGTPFLEAYESLLARYGTDYAAVAHRHVDEREIRAFFAPGACLLRKFENHQVVDFDSLKGRVLSSSYMPEEGDANYQPALAEIRRIFEAHERGGSVTLEYDTEVYYGRLEA